MNAGGKIWKICQCPVTFGGEARQGTGGLPAIVRSCQREMVLVRKSKFFENAHFFMFQKEESCDIIRMHLYTRPSKSTITAEEWRMMWKCPVCRYENKITRSESSCCSRSSWLRSWAMQRRSISWASAITAGAHRRTRPRPFAGSAGPPSRATPRHSMCWAFAAKEAKA